MRTAKPLTNTFVYTSTVTPYPLNLFEYRIQGYFKRFNFDDDARFLLSLFNRIDITIKSLFTCVELREFVRMSFCANFAYLYYVTSYFDPTAVIVGIYHKQRHLWIGTHIM